MELGGRVRISELNYHMRQQPLFLLVRCFMTNIMNGVSKVDECSLVTI